MAVTLFGAIGAGKTYYAVKNFLLPALASDNHVFTNIDLGYNSKNLEWIPAYKFSDYLGKDCRHLLHTFRRHDDLLDRIKMDFQDDIEGHSLRIPHHSTVIVDEAHDIFYYLNANSVDKRVYNFLAYARHFDINMIFLSQAPDLMCKFVQQLSTGNIIKIKNLASFGVKGGIKVFRYHSIAQTYRDDGFDSTETHVYDKSIFNLYRSSLCSENQNKFVFPKFLFVPILVFLALAFFWVFSNGRRFF